MRNKWSHEFSHRWCSISALTNLIQSHINWQTKASTYIKKYNSRLHHSVKKNNDNFIPNECIFWEFVHMVNRFRLQRTLQREIKILGIHIGIFLKLLRLISRSESAFIYEFNVANPKSFWTDICRSISVQENRACKYLPTSEAYDRLRRTWNNTNSTGRYWKFGRLCIGVQCTVFSIKTRLC